MIYLNAITEWGRTHPWASEEQIEQDLLLARAVCEIASNDYLSKELVFRGGTAISKLYTDTAYRYSEDLDYVRTTTGSIGPLLTALRDIGESLGFTVATKVSQFPKVYWKTTARNGLPLRIKIEVNTHERESALPLVNRNLVVSSQWWSGHASVQTYQLPELVASKLRALYQRSKGRDLFDIWLALKHLKVNPDEVIEAFPLYRPEKYTANLAISNLNEKLESRVFRADLDSLARVQPIWYDIDNAGELVVESLLSKVQ